MGAHACEIWELTYHRPSRWCEREGWAQSGFQNCASQLWEEPNLS